ncbi:antitoxin [Conexibacter sp. DBS9H8]|uniref:antitoxin n=1 Tax=Conexibacter sp. DBS9H8 TaxID=2937801 RepID=UPI00200C5DE7|nr:antitoxin [Conexibacter sp. DBS9H8]
MGFRERLSDLTSRAEKTAAEHKEEIRRTITKAEAAADQQTGGKYHDKIEQVGARAGAYVEGLQPEQPRSAQPARPESSEPHPSEPHPEQ